MEIGVECMWRLRLNCEPLEEVECFKNLGSQVPANGGSERDVVHKMNARVRGRGGVRTVRRLR